MPRTRASPCADEAFPGELGRSGRTVAVRPVGRGVLRPVGQDLPEQPDHRLHDRPTVKDSTPHRTRRAGLGFVTALTADAALEPPTDAHHFIRNPDPITLTVPGTRHLLVAVFAPPAVTAARLLHWSNWRRRHQGTARRSHYRRRNAKEPAG